MVRLRRFGPALALAVAVRAASPAAAFADEPAKEAKPAIVDRVIGRWRVAEGGRPGKARPIFARQLAFEARIEAMAGGEPPTVTLIDRHVRAALARHVTESLLAELPLEPAPSPAQIGEQAAGARRVLVARVGGEQRLMAALERERLSTDELDAILRRTARASLYLDRMVAPQIEPTDLELRQIHAAGQTPFSKERFVDVAEELKRWVMSQRLAETLDAFYQRARARVTITWARPRPRP